MLKKNKLYYLIANFADASGRVADAARISPAWLEPAGVRASEILVLLVLEILAAKERSPRCIGNVAKWEFIFLRGLRFSSSLLDYIIPDYAIRLKYKRFKTSRFTKEIKKFQQTRKFELILGQDKSILCSWLFDYYLFSLFFYNSMQGTRYLRKEHTWESKHSNCIEFLVHLATMSPNSKQTTTS